MEQRIISEDKLNSYHLDLRSAQKGQINESFLAMFGEALKTILKRCKKDAKICKTDITNM